MNVSFLPSHLPSSICMPSSAAVCYNCGVERVPSGRYLVKLKYHPFWRTCSASKVCRTCLKEMAEVLGPRKLGKGVLLLRDSKCKPWTGISGPEHQRQDRSGLASAFGICVHGAAAWWISNRGSAASPVIHSICVNMDLLFITLYRCYNLQKYCNVNWKECVNEQACLVLCTT